MSVFNPYSETVLQLKKVFEDLEAAQRFSVFCQLQWYSGPFLLIIQMLHIKKHYIFWSLSFCVSKMGTVQISFALPNSILIIYLKLEFTEELIKSIFFIINRRNIFWNKKLKRIQTSCKPFKKVYAKLPIFICILLAVKSSCCFPLKPDFYSSTCKYLHCSGNLMWS